MEKEKEKGKGKKESKKKGADGKDGKEDGKDGKDGKDAKDGKDKADAAAAPPPEPKDPRVALMDDIKSFVSQLERGVETKDKRLLTRVAMKINSVRHRLDPAMLEEVVKMYIPPTNNSFIPLSNYLAVLKQQVDVKMDVAPAPAPASAPASAPAPAASGSAMPPKLADGPAAPVRDTAIPEVEIYVDLLLFMMLLDKKLLSEAVQFSLYLVNHRLPQFNHRTMDYLSAKVYYYYSLAHERVDRLVDIRRSMLALHRTACLRHDEPGQATLTNLILRNFLRYNLYAQADKFRLNTKPLDARSSNQHARYLFYIGKILSMQLHYSEAFNSLTQAVRKAPSKGAVGFRQAAHKLLVIVQLLMGDIPERATFRQADLKRSLKPYLQLTQAVRVGDLAAFKDVMNTYKATFARDGVYHLIVRLRHNVIKTGLRKISLSYSRISIQDITTKLSLESTDDCEYIVAKAIHDGVIDAVIDHAGGFVFSKENTDIYSSTAPQAAFHKRIQFCMDIHKESVKAFRFPPNAYKKVEQPTEGPDLSTESPPEDAS